MTTNTNDWEVFEGTRTRQPGMSVRIYKSGQFSLTADVREALGGDSAVLLYNHERNQIGLRAAAPDDTRAYKLRRPKSQSTWLVNAAAFLKHYGLEEWKGQSFPARLEDDLIVVDLRPKS